MTTFAHLITPTGLTAFIAGNQYAVPKDHPNFANICAAVKAGKYAEAIEMIDIRASVRKFISTDPRFALVNDLIELDGAAFSGPVTDKVLELIEAGNAPEPLFKFLTKVRQNPSKAAQDELLLFCVANKFMIDTDGNIVAYKSVRGDYKDIHSGTFDNSVGTVNKMPRFQVDDDRNRTCSAGLHFASFEYASTWAGDIDGVNRRLMVLAVNPANVVAIPADYHNQKGRCSEYTVVAEIGGQPLPPKSVYTPADLGASAPSDALRLAAEKAEQKRKFSEALARKQSVLSKITAEIAQMTQNQRAIIDLGGAVPLEQRLELSRKSGVRARMVRDISDLTAKIASL